uniref:Uncharacterized protein n=1 Tax=viral metagenome TaxID=1070528 RepID=A0A6M3K2J1_9ZZZZ
MATAQNIIDASLARYKDSNEDAWVDDELLAYLNKAVGHAHNVLVRHGSEMAATLTTVTLATGTQEYALPSDFLAVVQDGVWLEDYNPMEPVPYSQKIYQGSSQATPTRFYLTRDRIGFIPVPSAAATVNEYYYTTPVTLAVGTSMPYDDLLDEPLSTFMSSLAFSRDELDTSLLNETFNTLEKSVLDVVDRRSPLRPVIHKPYGNRME